MRILKVWIIARNGLQLINTNIHYENGEYKLEAEIFKNGDDRLAGMTRASAISSFQHFFEDLLIQRPCRYILFDDIILIFHRWKFHYAISSEIIKFSILVVAHIDNSILLNDQEKVLQRFAELVGWEFYTHHHQDLTDVMVNLIKLKPFSTTCEELAHLPEEEIDDRITAFEKKLGIET